jgi:hypothetical protein
VFDNLNEVSNVGRKLLHYSVVEPLNILEQALILLGNKVDGNTLASKAPRTTDTVQVVLWVVGKVIIDDQRDLLDVNTTGKQVGGDEYTTGARSELTHDNITSVLVHVSVSGTDSVVTLTHLVSQPVNLAAGVGKDDALGDGQSLIQVAQSVKFPVFLVNIDIKLFDTFQGELIALDKNTNWLVHKLASDFKSLGGEGSGEDSHLNLGWKELEDVIDLVFETTAEHFISFIEDKHADRVRLEGTTAKHVVDTARGTDNDMNTSLKDSGVFTDRSTADAGMALDTEVVTQSTHDLFDLLGKLTGGGEDQGLAFKEVVVKVLENASAKGGSLTGTRLSLLDDVKTLAKGYDALLLDSRWLFETCCVFGKGKSGLVNHRMLAG